MKEDIEFWVKIIAGAGTVTTAIFAVLKYRIASRKAKPVFLKRSTCIVDHDDQSLPDIEMFYKGELINSLTITNIAIWNSGKKAIRATDIPSADVLRLEVEQDVKIFEVRILKEINPSNKFILIEDLTNPIFAQINFDYMGYKEGVVIQVVHNGLGSSDIKAYGKTIDYGDFRNYESETKSSTVEGLLESKISKLMPEKESKKGVFIVSLIVGILLTSSALFMPVLGLQIIIGIVGLVYLGFAFTFKAFTSIPKEFEFMEE